MNECVTYYNVLSRYREIRAKSFFLIQLKYYRNIWRNVNPHSGL